MVENTKLLKLVLSGAAISTAVFGILYLTGEDWFTGLCFLAVAVLSAEGAVRGPARFRFGLSVSVFAFFWTVQAIAAAIHGTWLVALGDTVLAVTTCAFWVIPWRERERHR